MKSLGVVELKIFVSGKDKQECGSKESPCRFENWNDRCLLFNRHLEKDKNQNSLRCKECRNIFKWPAIW